MRLDATGQWLALLIILSFSHAAPSHEPVGKLVYTITHGDEPQRPSASPRLSTSAVYVATTHSPESFPTENNPLSMFSNFVKGNDMMKTVMKLIDSFTGSALRDNKVDELKQVPRLNDAMSTFAKTQRDSVVHSTVDRTASKAYAAPVRVFHSTDERIVHQIHRGMYRIQKASLRTVAGKRFLVRFSNEGVEKGGITIQ
uniref:FTP domain-containing protein n=1 Tax=Steinernema glaseri TaxID=37863 RepID=A0A1I7YTI0_9BILA